MARNAALPILTADPASPIILRKFGGSRCWSAKKNTY